MLGEHCSQCSQCVKLRHVVLSRGHAKAAHGTTADAALALCAFHALRCCCAFDFNSRFVGGALAEKDQLCVHAAAMGGWNAVPNRRLDTVDVCHAEKKLTADLPPIFGALAFILDHNDAGGSSDTSSRPGWFEWAESEDRLVPRAPNPDSEFISSVVQRVCTLSCQESPGYHARVPNPGVSAVSQRPGGKFRR